MSYNHCHLVEEADRPKAKLMAGTMHQAGWPGGTSPLTGGGLLSDPGLDPLGCMMHGKAPWGGSYVGDGGR